MNRAAEDRIVNASSANCGGSKSGSLRLLSVKPSAKTVIEGSVSLCYEHLFGKMLHLLQVRFGLMIISGKVQ